MLWGRYWLTYDGGLNVRHFIKMLRRFSGAFRTAVEEMKQSQPSGRLATRFIHSLGLTAAARRLRRARFPPAAAFHGAPRSTSMVGFTLSALS